MELHFIMDENEWATIARMRPTGRGAMSTGKRTREASLTQAQFTQWVYDIRVDSIMLWECLLCLLAQAAEHCISDSYGSECVITADMLWEPSVKLYAHEGVKECALEAHCAALKQHFHVVE